MSKVKLAIVEDERLVARDLKMRLTAVGYEVAAVVHTFQEASQLLQATDSDIDLMIIDIELDGAMDGIRLAQLIQKEHDFPFIFLTSHTTSEIVTEARKTGPSAYLIKPFREREVQIAIDLAISNYAGKQPGEDSSQEDNVYIINDSFFIKKKFKYEKVRIEDILFAEAQRNYTLIKTQAESYLLSLTLKSVIDRLTYPYFIQSHRSYLLNLMHITGFEGNIVYLGDAEVPVSKNYRETVFKRFQTF
ncbi:MAG: response regulator transcription factor [Roseivirga sp.]|nr:response regulator transcription factor [Roseivirga sp.]